MRPEALEVAQRWLKKADTDLRTIKILMASANPPFESVCFHAQQAAEKLLKGLLTAYEIPFPKTHDLVVLVKRLPSSSQLDIALDIWVELSYYAISSRYPDDVTEYTLALAQDLWNKALSVNQAVRKQFSNLQA